VTAIRQVTHDGATKDVPFTDGSRVYYSATVAGGLWLMQAPVTGGDSIRLETTLRRPLIQDILPRRSGLLVEDDLRWWVGDADPVWLVPTVGGSPRPLGEVEGFAGVSADERHIVFARGSDLFLAQGDGSEARSVLIAPGIAVRPRLSPDARRVRYTVIPTTGRGSRSIWEAATDGRNAHSTGLFVAFLGGLSATCVEFSRDGRWITYVRHPDRTLWRSRPDGSDRLQLTFAVAHRKGPDRDLDRGPPDRGGVDHSRLRGPLLTAMVAGREVHRRDVGRRHPTATLHARHPELA
jgi:hypothetical protein